MKLSLQKFYSPLFSDRKIESYSLMAYNHLPQKQMYIKRYPHDKMSIDMKSKMIIYTYLQINFDRRFHVIPLLDNSDNKIMVLI